MKFIRFKCNFFVHLFKWTSLLLISFTSFAQVDVGFDGGEGVVLRDRVHPARYTFFFEQFDELELGPNEEILKLIVQPKSIKFYDNPELKGEPIATIDKDAIRLDGKVVYPSHKVTWDCKGCYYRYFYGSSFQGNEVEVPYLYIRQGDIAGAFVQYIYADEFKNGVAKVSKFNKFNSIDEVVDIPLKKDFYFRPSDVSKFYYTPPGEVLRDRFLSKYPSISKNYQFLRKCVLDKKLECIKKACNLYLIRESASSTGRLDESIVSEKALELFNANSSRVIEYIFEESERERDKYQKLRIHVVSPRSNTVRMAILSEGEPKMCSLFFGYDYKLSEQK